MLTMPRNTPSVVSICGLDPGSNTLGVGVICVDVATMSIVSSEAWTLVGTKLAGKYNWVGEIHGDRLGRIAALEEKLLQIFNFYQPIEIASESPFYSQRRPQAFGALTEVICAIRRSVMLYDVWKQLHLVDPPTVKKAVGAPGNAQKDVVKEKLLLLSNLNYIGAVPMRFLDEHSIDALAVAYCRYQTLMEKLCLNS